MDDESNSPPTEAELKAHLKELEMEYDLARMGMLKSGYATLYMSILALFGLVLSFVIKFYKDQDLFSGIYIVLLALIVAGALVTYSSFVFGRTARIRAKINRTETEIEIASGKKVR